MSRCYNWKLHMRPRESIATVTEEGNGKLHFVITPFMYVSPADTSCSSRGLVRQLCCQGRDRDTPWHLGPCTPLHLGLCRAAAWPDHCLPSTSLTAAATGSAQPCLRHSSLSPWPCCSLTSSVSCRHAPSPCHEWEARRVSPSFVLSLVENLHFQKGLLEELENCGTCQESA